jgi:GPH family glycoside/pentoside/hexuronide:cation symporter
MGLYLYFYYFAVIGLSASLILLATAINTVWGAFNDPLIGYLTDKNFKWTRKWGRRFPWIVIGVIPWCFVLILIFAAPDATVSPWPAFTWLLLMLLLNELFVTLSDVHTNMLRADKFRTEYERKKYSGFFGSFDMIAMALGSAVPPLLVFGAESIYYTIMAAIIAVVALVCAILFVVNGAREDKIIIDRYYSSDYEEINYFKGIWGVLKQKSFVGFWFSAAGWGIATTMMTSMIAFVTTFVLKESEEVMFVLLALFIVGALISVPLWLRVLKRIGDPRRIYIIGSACMCIALIPLTFFTTTIDLAIFMFLVGMSMGCVWTLQIPVIFSHVQDDFVIRTGKNQKGILIGTWAVLGLFTAFIDELIFMIVFAITGFDSGLQTYTELELSGANVVSVQWGIKFLVGVIPMILMALGTFLFWRIYPLTQEKVLENKAKLKEIGF